MVGSVIVAIECTRCHVKYTQRDVCIKVRLVRIKAEGSAGVECPLEHIVDASASIFVPFVVPESLSGLAESAGSFRRVRSFRLRTGPRLDRSSTVESHFFPFKFILLPYARPKRAEHEAEDIRSPIITHRFVAFLTLILLEEKKQDCKARWESEPQPPTSPGARISPRNRLFVMDTSSLHEFVATPIKNFLRLQRIKEIKWMNPRACTNEAYIPTPIEHVANVATHGIWVVPSVIGSIELIRRSTTWTQFVSAYVYGTSLVLVFAVSTFFHSVHYCNHRQLKDALHRCDRAMIYIFIAASYFPWLNVDHFPDDELLPIMRYAVWIMAILGIVYQQIFHERYKMLETIFYLLMGIGPSVAIINVYNYYNIAELKMGGLIYVLGLLFFKSDGRIPCAHAIWHLFVAAAAGFHYYAILNHVFPPVDSIDEFGPPGVPPLPKLLKSHSEL